MPQKSKPPAQPRRVMADDIEIDIGGDIYHPHVGEWVEFKGRPSVGLYLKIAQLGDSPEGLSLLLERIHAWTFTDDEGTPYENPPTYDTLMRLPKEELAWLIENVSAAGMTEEALKNGSTPST